jgi:Xaa-Pro aminopeptidase
MGNLDCSTVVHIGDQRYNRYFSRKTRHEEQTPVNHSEQRQRTTDLLKAQGVSRALFASPHSMTWLTGFAPMIELGSLHPFAGGPSLVWYEDGHFTLIAVDAYAGLVAPLDGEPALSFITYPGYTIQQPITSGARLTALLREQFGGISGGVGVEMQHLPLLLAQTLLGSPTITLQPIDDWLVPLRRVKTDVELAKLRRNFALTDLGHKIARQETQTGKREIDVWSAVHAALMREVGGRVALGNDCVANTRRENNIGGAPEDVMLGEGDSLTVDLSTIHQGYWSDSCMTYYTQQPSAQQAKAHQTAREALEYGISLVKPGVVAKDLDQKIRAFIEKAGYPVYPHHTGHAVGVSPHESPRIVPYNDEVLAAGMVIMLEPGIYIPGEISVRIEDGLLITADGVEVLTSHDKR